MILKREPTNGASSVPALGVRRVVVRQMALIGGMSVGAGK